MKKIILFAQVLLISFKVPGQLIPKRMIEENSLKSEIESLRLHYGYHKSLIKKYELATLVALSYYPELRGTEIKFIYKNIKTSMAARPYSNFIFKKSASRKYAIYIDNKLKGANGLLVDDIPFNGQVGIIAHELGHVLDYSRKSSLTILGTGINYSIFQNYKKKFEQATDSIAIAHKVGWQLYDFAYYVLYQSHASKEYKTYKKSIYMQPEDILKLINKNDAYQLTLTGTH